MKKGIIAILVLAVLGGGAFWLLKGGDVPATDSSNKPPVSLTEPQTETDPGETAATDTATVSYNGTAFSPATLTVKAGTKVNFENASTGPMWVASDPHPVHTDFAEFDAKRNYTQNQTYSFTFDEPGEYEYHNHSNSGATGTVVVE